MSSEYRIKLRKQYNLVEEPDLLFEKFNCSLGPNSNPIIGKIVKPNIFLQIDDSERHYWSPEMTITMEQEDDKTRIREVIGPNSSVFTLTMFMIFFAGTLFLFTLMFLFSQLTLNMDTSFTWVIIGVCFLLFLIISLFMFIGRIKAKPQMELFRQFVEEVLN